MEDDLIHYLKEKTKTHQKWINGMGVGDDAAHLSLSKSHDLVICSDSLVEGVHFDLKSIPPKDLGWKSLAVNLSDLASMGAKPKGSLLNISLPKKYTGSWINEFIQGYLEISQRYKVPLLGGDTTSSLNSVFISVTALGEAQVKKIKKRSTADAGDILCVTGPLGDSKAGLFLQNKSWKSPIRNKLLKKHHRPVPRVEMGLWLSTKSSVTSMMDLSDGLIKDLTRLCEASRVSVELDHSSVPQSSELKSFSQHFKKSHYEYASIGGEDYELLLTVDSKRINQLNQEFKRKFKSELFPIGRILKSKKEKIEWRDPAFAKIAQNFKSFEHF